MLRLKYSPLHIVGKKYQWQHNFEKFSKPLIVLTLFCIKFLPENCMSPEI